MDIPLNAEVFCEDGLVGHSSCILVNPVRQVITHFVLKRNDLLGYEEMVPIDHIKESNRDMILLHGKRAELIDLQPFVKSEYIDYDESSNESYDFPLGGDYGFDGVYGWPYRELQDVHNTRIGLEQTPLGESGLHRGTHVEATDGRVGQVDEFLVEPEHCHITHLVLRERHFLGDKDVTIPIAEIQQIENDVVRLKLTREQVKKLPHVPAK